MESSEKRQALGGLRVIELAVGMAGPWIGRFMAYCGAEVIKVESRNHPDVTRLYVPPRAPEMGVQPQLSPWFTDWNAGKRFVALDLTRPEAVDLCKRLVAISDVVIENYSTGVIDKLGLGYKTLASVKPDIVMLGSSGYGGSGPYARYVTWGPNIEALAGLSAISGFPKRACTITQYAYPDALSALHGLFAVMCALDHRTRTGYGQYIDLSQLETTVSSVGHVMMETLANGREPSRLGNRSLQAAPHGCYRCQGQDRWCVIAVRTDTDWKRFCAVVEKPEWLSDPRFTNLEARLRNAAALDTLIEKWTAARAPYDVMHRLQSADIAAGVVQTTEDQWKNDPQLAARGFFEQVEHAKKGTVVANGVPLGLTGTPGHTRQAGTPMAKDNEYVFATLLGMTPGQIREGIDAGAIEPGNG